MNATTVSDGDAFRPRACAPPIQIRLSADTEATLKKATAASTGALMTSLFVTPLDVAKVRLQAQVMKSTSAVSTATSQISSRSMISYPGVLASGNSSRCICAKRSLPVDKDHALPRPTRSLCFASYARCFSWRARTKACPGRSLTRPTATALAPANFMSLPVSMTSNLPTTAMTAPAQAVVVLRNTHAAASSVRLRGMTHALRHIFKTEGFAGLYSGLSPAMMIAIPSTVLYYVSYDKLLSEGKQHFPQFSPIVPLVSGSLARIVAATVTSPIELVRTRMQSDPNSRGVMRMLVQTLSEGGIHGLFRGLNATLSRDVPFSAIYWTCYEGLQQYTQQQPQMVELSRMQRAFMCGALSGSIAAAITTPFDVVKTLQQVNSSMQHHTTSEVLQRIVASRGVRGCFVGLTARLCRVAPSCAIMIATYELGKEKFGL